jgi:hypothetical protein
MRKSSAWLVCWATGVSAAAAVGALAPGCTTHECDTTSYDYFGGTMIDPNTYETSALNEPWIPYPGNVTVNIHFPKNVYRQPIAILGQVGTSATPNGGIDFMGGDNLSMAAGQLAEEFFIGPTGFSVNNASCAPYFARFVVTFPPITLTLFGGMAGGGNAGVQDLGDSWTWNGSQWTAADVVSTTMPGPTPRSGITMASASGSPFFFGGDEGSSGSSSIDAGVKFDNDFWQWNGFTWMERFWTVTPGCAGDGPEACIPYARAYEAFVTLPNRPQSDGGTSDAIVMFGGVTHDQVDGSADSANHALDDTWIWDGTGWLLVHPAQSPSPRWGAVAAVLDGSVVLFGGTSDGSTPLGDMWTWNDRAGTWSPIASTGPGPSPRFLASAATIGKKVVLFGGTDGVHDLGDTWLWDGAIWTEVNVPGPSPRSNASMGAFDVPDPALLLFGGFSRAATGNGFGNAALGDFWKWNGSGWQEVPQLGDTFPPPRGGAGMAGL